MNRKSDGMKNINPSRVLRLIWQKREITRIDIADELGLHKSTITNIINEAIAQGMVIETSSGQAGPQGGRRPIFLTINKDYGCAAGFEIQPSYWRLVIVNLDGEILYEQVEAERIDRRTLIPALSESLRDLAGRVKKLKTRLLGVGIGTSGIMNPDRGEIVQSIPLQIGEAILVAAPLEAVTGVPVHIDNDANCCAWGELIFHKDLRLENFLSVLIEIREEEIEHKSPGGLAVGLGIVIGGKVHYGSTFSAGEFRSAFSKQTDISQFSLTPKELLKLNTDHAIFRRFTDELAENVALLVNTLNVSHVFVSSFNVKYKNDLIPALKAKIAEKFPYTLKRECQIGFSSFGDKAVAYGAAGYILERIFAHPEIPKLAADEPQEAETGRRT